MFSSNDLACFDLDGRMRWLRGFAYESPQLRNDSGMASSPLVIGQTVIVQCESQGEAFVAGIDTETGQTRWRNERARRATWSSPTLLAGGAPAKDLALVQDPDGLSAYRPDTGEIVWRYAAPCHATASVTTSGNRIYLPADGMHALQYDPASRSVRRLWVESRLRGGSMSPVAHGGRVYVIKSPAILVCADADDGRVLWQLRLQGPVWATPLLAGDRLYVVSHPGLVQAVDVAGSGKLVGTSQLEPEMLASPAAAHGAMYFRSQHYLWKVAFSNGR
jgi:outer membrane protein assembly factor BamB